MCLCMQYPWMAEEGDGFPPELELKAILSCQMGAPNQTWVLYKKNKCSQ